MSLNVALLRETFERVKVENGGATALGMAFYKRLFEKYPAVIPLFHTPPEEQHKKLIASLGAIVAGREMQETWEAANGVVAKTRIEAANNPEAYKDELAKTGYEPDGFRKNDNEPWLERNVAAV